ncbi:unnamed protein product [Rhizopus stolonifer]
MKFSILFSLALVATVTAVPVALIPSTTSSAPAATAIHFFQPDNYPKLSLGTVAMNAATTGIEATNASNNDKASSFQVTKPIESVTYKLGQAAKVSWDNGIAGNVVIDVLEGENPNSMQSVHFNANYPAQPGSGSFDVPINGAFDPKKTYCFVINYTVNGKGLASYSHIFKVTA